MNLQERIMAFVRLGEVLKKTLLVPFGNEENVDIFEKTYNTNSWHTQKDQAFAIEGILSWLNQQTLETWVGSYNLDQLEPKKIGLITASNIPLVGFHDIISILIGGHHLMLKTSSDDRVLTRHLLNTLVQVESEFENKITWVDERLMDFDAVICTGSDNSSRYFEYYFKKYPCIIRKNRNSIAVLTGNESKQDLKNLGKDIFQYHGLGCRNVSKLFVPKGYVFDRFFECLFEENDIINHNKYYNNYNYNKTIYLMNNEKLLDNGFLILKESNEISSPIGVLNYEYYNEVEEVVEQIGLNQDKIQCVVSANDVKFGTAQAPAISDYADCVDTMEFLSTL